MKVTIAILMFATLQPVSAGKLYRWVDEAGQVNYSDHLPVGVPYEAHTLAPPQGKGASGTGGGIRPGEYDLLKQSADREAAQLRSRKAASRAYVANNKRCHKARERYKEALSDSVSGSEDERERVKDYYAAMQVDCR